jgi:predicted outer membrane repeat protein
MSIVRRTTAEATIRHFSIVFLFLFNLFFPCAGSAATHTVNTLGDTGDASLNGTCDTDLVQADLQCTLRAAIQEVNANGGSSNTITVDESLANQNIILQSPLPPIERWTTINGPTGGRLEVYAATNKGILSVADGASPLVFTIKNISFQNSWRARGGAISVVGAHIVTIENGYFSFNNAAEGGGAVYCNGCSLIVLDSSFSANGAFGASIFGGGAIYLLDGTLTVESTMFYGNYGAFGGALYIEDSPTTVRDSFFENNIAEDGFGGGLYYRKTLPATKDVTIEDSRFTGNRARRDIEVGAGYGGGAAIEYANTVIRRASFIGNEAESGSGGGIYLVGNGTVENTTLGANRAEEYGGGISVANGNLYLRSSTITKNTARRGSGQTGGGGGFFVGPGAGLTVQASIIAENNDRDGINPDCIVWPGTGTLTSLGYNIVGDRRGCSSGLLGSDYVGGLGTPPADPGLDVLRDNGAGTITAALLDSSPALDAIPEVLCPTTSVSVDQRGYERPMKGSVAGSGCDIGAYEADYCRNGVFDSGLEGGVDCGGALCRCGCPAPPKAKIPPVGYGGVQLAYDAAEDGKVIMLQGIPLYEDLLLDQAKNITLSGGYTCGYILRFGLTAIHGTVEIRSGRASFDKIQID